jgi:hypothetical protein
MIPSEMAAGGARGRRAIPAAVLAAGLLSACALSPQPPAQGPSQGASLGDPAGMIGADAGAVQRLLGPPRLVRRDAPAELWQYRARDCVVDLFLYQEKDGLRLAYVEARTGAAEITAPRPCLEALRAGREKSVTS